MTPHVGMLQIPFRGFYRRRRREELRTRKNSAVWVRALHAGQRPNSAVLSKIFLTGTRTVLIGLQEAIYVYIINVCFG